MARWWWLAIGLPCCSLWAATETLQDPTQPLQGLAGSGAVTQQAAALPRLQGLVQGRGPQQALLNGHSYRLGDSVAGYRLVAIHRDGVV
ncbi:MAG: MSHA biogenesis protein MshK, partial [Aeromonas sp.]|nr:MSHA biogenesis protein MshK [Aeromonas sp.]